MNIKELSAHVNDNVQNDRNAGDGLLAGGLPSGAHSIRDIMWEEPSKYELSPKMVLINGIECVAGMTKAPKRYTKYVTADGVRIGSCTVWIWNDGKDNFRHLESGISFPHTKAGRNNAMAMWEAMLNFKEVK